MCKVLLAVERSLLGAAAIVLLATTVAAQSERRASERTVGGPCEGCDAVFVGMPASLEAQARIAPAGERGERLLLRGRVLDPDGAAVAGVIVYAYHTDSTGIYPADAALAGTPAGPHGRLRGWARSNEHGHYAFETVRPGPYPDRSAPQHIHMHVLEERRCTYYISDVEFTDDPRLTPPLRERAERRGGSGVATPARDGRGVWVVQRDIHLGHEIQDYGACSAEN